MSEAAIEAWWAEHGGIERSAEQVAGDWRVRAVYNPHGASTMAAYLIADDLWSDLGFSVSGLCRRGRAVGDCASHEQWVFAQWGEWVVALASDAIRVGHHDLRPVTSLVVLERISETPTYIRSHSQGPGRWPPEHAFRKMEPALELWDGREGEGCHIGLGVSAMSPLVALAEPIQLDVWGCPEPAAELVRVAIGCWRLEKHEPLRAATPLDNARIWYVETVAVDASLREATARKRRCQPVPRPQH